MRIDHQRLRRLTVAMLAAMGSTAEEPSIVADHLVEANLKGHPSHGVGLMPTYIRHWRAVHLRTNQHAERVRLDGNMAVFDGHMGFGQVIAREAMQWAIETTREKGSSMHAVRHSQHIGRVGTYAEQAAAAGLMSIHFVNAVSHASLRVAPFGGTDGRISTEPFCVGVPMGVGVPPVILDFATSQVALGKVRVAHRAGTLIEDGALVDHEGQPTRDPAVIYEKPLGAITSMGRHKGSGLAIVCSLLGGALSGGGTSQPNTPRDRGTVNGLFCVTFDPDRMIGVEAFREEATAFLDYVKASPAADPAAPVLVAGEPEHLHRIRALADGIELDEGSWREFCAAANGLGVAV